MGAQAAKAAANVGTVHALSTFTSCTLQNCLHSCQQQDASIHKGTSAVGNGTLYLAAHAAVAGLPAEVLVGVTAGCRLYTVDARSESLCTGRLQLNRSPRTARVCHRPLRRGPNGSNADVHASSTLSTHGQPSP